MAHLGYLGWRGRGESELIKSGSFSEVFFRQKLSVTCFHLTYIHLNSIWMQMSITMFLIKCPRDSEYLLEISLPFLSKIWHLCSLSHEKDKSLTSLNFSSHSDSDILGFWARSWSTTWKCTLILETSEGIAAWRRPVCPSSSSVWQYWLISLEDTLPGIWSLLYLENVLLCYIYTANSKQPSMYAHMVHPKA